MAPAETRVSAETAITLRVPLPEHCPLYDKSGDILSANPHFVDGICRSEFILQTEETGKPQLVMASDPLSSSSCVCKEIRSHGGVPIFDRVHGDTLTLSFLLQSRDDACALYQDLTDCAPETEVCSIVSEGDFLLGDSSPGGMDLLTEKQTEALVLAVCHGYYETPRETDIESLAERCGISRQAFSHRLRQAEGTILDHICQGTESQRLFGDRDPVEQ